MRGDGGARERGVGRIGGEANEGPRQGLAQRHRLERRAGSDVAHHAFEERSPKAGVRRAVGAELGQLDPRPKLRREELREQWA